MRRFRWHLRSFVGRDVHSRVELRCDTDHCSASIGGWTICPNGIDAQAVVYSLGLGDDISWDRYMIERFGVTVHGFDPTPMALDWLERQRLPEKLIVHPYGVADFDGEATFRPANKAHQVNRTIAPMSNVALDAVALPVRRLTTIMQELGHERIDLLKMDIEGAEYGVIDELVRLQLDVRQLLVEFHHRFPSIGVAPTKRALSQLRDAGYRVFAISDSGQEYSLLRE
jgi:FkbM family methyltransferase